jgi:hypothetical protein
MTIQEYRIAANGSCLRIYSLQYMLDRHDVESLSHADPDPVSATVGWRLSCELDMLTPCLADGQVTKA